MCSLLNMGGVRLLGAETCPVSSDSGVYPKNEAQGQEDEQEDGPGPKLPFETQALNWFSGIITYLAYLLSLPTLASSSFTLW